MACRMVFSERFLDDASCVWSERLRLSRVGVLSNIEAFPEIGSKNLPLSIKEEFGDAVRKAAVSPFDLIYEFKEEENAVFVYALVPMRSVR